MPQFLAWCEGRGITALEQIRPITVSGYIAQMCAGDSCYNGIEMEVRRMAHLEQHQPSKTYRGTWDEVMAHSAEIPKTSEVELRVFDTQPTEEDPTVALLESWIAQAPTDPEAIREAEEDLREFKRNMNIPRKETGARLPYPEAE